MEEQLEKLWAALAEDEAPHNHTEILASAARSHFGWSTPTAWGAAKLGYRSRDAEVAELLDALNRWLVADKAWLESGNTLTTRALAHNAATHSQAILAKHAKAGKGGRDDHS